MSTDRDAVTDYGAWQSTFTINCERCADSPAVPRGNKDCQTALRDAVRIQDRVVQCPLYNPKANPRRERERVAKMRAHRKKYPDPWDSEEPCTP